MSEWTVTGFASLSATDRDRVDVVRQACESAEPLDLKLELDEGEAAGEPIHFLAEADGDLVGYAGITPGDEAEACGMVTPAWRGRGIGTELLNHVLGAGRRLGRESVLFICEDAGAVALAWLHRLGAADDSAEQRMTVRLDARADAGTGHDGVGAPLELRPAGEADRDALTRIRGDDFLSTFDFSAPDELMIALDDGVEVGTLRLTATPRRSMVYGFVIDPERRGQRLGTRMLEAVLELLRSRGVTEVGLEVDPENTPAVGLYRAFGFVTVTMYRYLRLASSLAGD